MSQYSTQTQVAIDDTCYTLHNFIFVSDGEFVAADIDGPKEEPV